MRSDRAGAALRTSPKVDEECLLRQNGFLFGDSNISTTRSINPRIFNPGCNSWSTKIVAQMQCHIRDHVTRHGSVTNVHSDGMSEDARSSCSEADQSQAVHSKPPPASIRALQDAGLLGRILLLVTNMSDRANAQAILRASRVNKTWHSTIAESLNIQRRLWFSPHARKLPDKRDFSETKTAVRFNPILWPQQPKHGTIDVTQHQLHTGNRGPGGWRRMLVASTPRPEFMVCIKVAEFPVAIVKCTANTTMGMLLEEAKEKAAESGDFVEPPKARAVCDDYICFRDGLPMWEMCDRCREIDLSLEGYC
ncbi:hypothetical protein CERZMDRAFT_97123 [Cercospora zeae-maydis SCOH1-5]|uniref:F-box domain-containing protein n=1 Tax=Cercospora zeae-maydis SCOH1-5 TaxID=717836 RepID=A0A6A6FGP7_9PEZI|nr:hypothetical protein CERZMDRAFT_97123 [Cercospora zeae-maydis SCOH1-5]